MSFYNASAHLRCTCTRGVSCAGLFLHVAYVLLFVLARPCGLTGRLQSQIVEGVLSVVRLWLHVRVNIARVPLCLSRAALSYV